MRVPRLGIVRPLSTVPWFVDANPAVAGRPVPKPAKIHPLTEEEPVPQPLRILHAQLATSTYLSALLVTCPPSPPQTVDPLPYRVPAGRRRRRGTLFPGDLNYYQPGGLWSWLMFAEVKEGTETRGSIEAVVRQVRQSLLEQELALPPNTKKRVHNGWSMVDAGNFAVHVLSRTVRERYFGYIPFE